MKIKGYKYSRDAFEGYLYRLSVKIFPFRKLSYIIQIYTDNPIPENAYIDVSKKLGAGLKSCELKGFFTVEQDAILTDLYDRLTFTNEQDII